MTRIFSPSTAAVGVICNVLVWPAPEGKFTPVSDPPVISMSQFERSTSAGSSSNMYISAFCSSCTLTVLPVGFEIVNGMLSVCPFGTPTETTFWSAWLLSFHTGSPKDGASPSADTIPPMQ